MPKFYRCPESYREHVAFRVDVADDYDASVFHGAVLHRYPMGWSMMHVGPIFVGVLDGTVEMDPPR